jgi:hypothetical protein
MRMGRVQTPIASPVNPLIPSPSPLGAGRREKPSRVESPLSPLDGPGTLWVAVGGEGYT